MIEKLKKAYLALQISSDPDPKAHFFRTDTRTGKKSKVSLISDASGIPQLILSSPDPISQLELNTELQNIMSAVHLPQALTGNNVILQAAGPTPVPGVKYQLSAGDWYYAINGGPINCNGQQLGQNYQGKFIRRLTAKCSSGTPTQYYDEYKLY